MKVRKINEPDNSEILRKCLTLLGFFVVFALLCIPCYFLMSAGAKRPSETVTEEAEEPQSAGEGSGGTEAPAGKTYTAGSPGGKYFTADDGFDDDFDDEFDEHVPNPDMYDSGGGYQPKETFTPEEMLYMTYKLNGFAFFGGLVLILILYTVLFELVLKKMYYPLMQGDRNMLIYSLLPLGFGVFFQILEITFIPMHITKGVASFVGIPWEIAYVVPVYMVALTLIGVWLDVNHNKMVYIDDDIFHYVQFGKGLTPLVIIPGLSLQTLEGKGNMLSFLHRVYSDKYTVYIMDKRDEVAEDVTLEDLAEDIAAVMDCIGVARANVIGISMGGMIAQYLAVNHPDKVGKLVLGVTSYQLNDSIREYVNHNILMAKKGELGKLQEENFRKIHTRQYYSKHKKWVSLFSKIGIPKSNTRFIRLSQSILTLDMEERIHDIISPVLVLGAGEDKIVGKTAADDLVRELKCERYVYRKLGHGVYGEESKDFHERILRFMEKA